MHYKDGTPVKLGDLIKGKDYNDYPYFGIVIGGHPGAERCNLEIAAFVSLNSGIAPSGQVIVGHVGGRSGRVAGVGAVAVVHLGSENSGEIEKIDHLPLGILPPITGHERPEPETPVIRAPDAPLPVRGAPRPPGEVTAGSGIKPMPHVSAPDGGDSPEPAAPGAIPSVVSEAGP